MKTVQIEEPGKVNVVERDRKLPGKGEVLLRLRYVGLCGSDLSTYLGKNPLVKYPRIPGHEISARIEQAGEGVPADLSVGDEVSVVPYTSCGACPSCLRGRSHACQYNQTLGVQRDGALQDYLCVPWKKVVKGPGLGARELAMVEPLTVGFHAIERGRVQASEVVMVLGCGMIGAGVIVAAVRKGATVVAVDLDDHKLGLASDLGAHHLVNSSTQDLSAELQGITRQRGPDVVIEAAGNPQTYRTAMDQVAFTGRVVCIGYAGSEVSFATRLFVQKELDILGSRNAEPGDFDRVMDYLRQGTFPLEALLSRVVGPEDVGEALQEWAGNPGKIMKILVEF
jgi:2-desacetyl-2-hydroxyethyl bacteriochlorophyllide A dehydrogenase